MPPCLFSILHLSKSFNIVQEHGGELRRRHRAGSPENHSDIDRRSSGGRRYERRDRHYRDSDEHDRRHRRRRRHRDDRTYRDRRDRRRRRDDDQSDFEKHFNSRMQRWMNNELSVYNAPPQQF